MKNEELRMKNEFYRFLIALSVSNCPFWCFASFSESPASDPSPGWPLGGGDGFAYFK